MAKELYPEARNQVGRMEGIRKNVPLCPAFKIIVWNPKPQCKLPRHVCFIKVDARTDSSCRQPAVDSLGMMMMMMAYYYGAARG